MRRRDFVKAISATAVVWSGDARTQGALKMRRIGLLLPNTPAIVARNPRLAAFLQELRSLGWVEGNNLTIERRFAHGEPRRLNELAADLARADVEIIVTAAAPAALAAKRATSKIPIVMLDPGDPIQTGLVQSLARPGGNVTGVTSIAPDLAAKRLALLKEAVPALTTVAMLFNAAIPPAEIAMTELQTAAERLSLRILPIAAHGQAGLSEALANLAVQRPTGLLVFPDPLTFSNQQAIVDVLLAGRVPGLFGAKEFAEIGGLMSYGPSYPAMFRRGAYYVDRILKGASPADLPVEQPTKFELVVNLNTAKAMRLELSPVLLARIDAVIE